MWDGDEHVVVRRDGHRRRDGLATAETEPAERRDERRERPDDPEPAEAGRVELADRRAAGRAVAEVGAEVEHRVRVGGARRERRERRRELLAGLARLELGVDLQEPRAALGHAAIHLRVGPSQGLADLGVREPLRLQQERLRLVGLQATEGLFRAADALAAGEEVVDGALVGAGALVLVEVVGGDLIRVPAADRHRLMLDDDTQPAELRRRIERVEPAHVDLECALDRVLGVLGVRGPVLGDPEERPVMLADESRHPGLRDRIRSLGHRTHRQGTRLLRSLER